MGELPSDMSPLKLAIFFVSSISLITAQSCDDFTEGLCPLSEDNVVGSTNSATVEECQSSCRNNTECNFFSFIGTQCFLLSSCNTTTTTTTTMETTLAPCDVTEGELCDDDVITGPPSPPISDCLSEPP